MDNLFTEYKSKLKESLDIFKNEFNNQIEIGVILGSGFKDLVNNLEIIKQIEFSKLKNFKCSSVSGHCNKFVIVKYNNKYILVSQGRIHLYEGFTPLDVVFPVAFIGELGIKKLILTNAAGGINKRFKPGDIMLIKDHINLQYCNPLIGIKSDNIFLDMSNIYDLEIIRRVKKKFNVYDGVYAGVLGPSYETKAEINYLKKIGADAVGMSTVIEAIMAHFYNMKKLGLSIIANKTLNLNQKLNHKDILQITTSSLELVKNIILFVIDEWSNYK